MSPEASLGILLRLGDATPAEIATAEVPLVARPSGNGPGLSLDNTAFRSGVASALRRAADELEKDADA